MLVLFYLLLIYFCSRRLRSLLRFFQQEEYDSPRFITWWLTNWLFDKRLSLVLLVGLGLGLWVDALLGLLIGLFGTALYAFKEPNPVKTGKKKLVMTARAKRIYFIALGFSAALGLLMFCCLPAPIFTLLLAIALVQALPLLLPLANALLSPWEKFVQRGYWQDAHTIVQRMKPQVIGITGSFGKTSVKHILGHILTTQAPTLITPGSVNTPMGIARIARERLTPDHRFFVVEMGAYGPGSIARLCRLTPPDVAVISAVGHAHYERFKTLEAVADTKFELADAVRDKNGPVIYNTATAEFKPVQNRLNTSYASEHWVGCCVAAEQDKNLPHPPQWVITNVEQTTSGLKLNVTVKGRKHVLEAPLFGGHQAYNIVFAAATAQAVGVPMTAIKTALKSTPQIAHRHEVKTQPNGSLLIDDAYNSNPIGFQTGLELLSLLAAERKGRRILITPGMIELGTAHDELHAKLGANASDHVDVLLPVVPKRIESFVTSFRDKAPKAQVIPCASFAEAQAWLGENLGPKDVVLLENDLPDLFESKPRF